MRWRVALVIVVALILVGIAALVISHEAGVETYRQSEKDASARGLAPIAFQFDHPTKLKVTGIDLSPEALALASENRALTGARVALVRGNLCQALAPASLDALVSNPPYLTAAEYAALDGSVRDWEPALALASGPDGLDAVLALLDAGREAERAGGWLALEIDCARAAHCAWHAGAFGWTDVAIHADLFGRERYLLARRSDAP
jgi:release factor glutamine methyltransferase